MFVALDFLPTSGRRLDLMQLSMIFNFIEQEFIVIIIIIIFFFDMCACLNIQYSSKNIKIHSLQNGP